jgi:hypothetical protein
MYNVISKYSPKELIQFSTRRNYLEHFLKQSGLLFVLFSVLYIKINI